MDNNNNNSTGGITTGKECQRNSETFFTVSGPNRKVQEFNEWLAKFTKGMTIPNALSAIGTNPILMRRISDFKGIKVTFCVDGLRCNIDAR